MYVQDGEAGEECWSAEKGKKGLRGRSRPIDSEEEEEEEEEERRERRRARKRNKKKTSKGTLT